MPTLYTRPETKVWYCRFSVAGKEYRLSTKEVDRRRAERAASRLEKEYESRISTNPLDLEPAFERALQWFTVNRRPSTVYYYRYAAKVLIEYLVNNHRRIKTVDRITPDIIQQFVEYRRQNGGGDIGIRNQVRTLSAIFRVMVSWRDEVLKENPVAKVDVSMLQAPRDREVYLTDEEVRLLINCMERPHQQDITQMAAETGMRKGEILSLRWRNVHLSAAQVVLRSDETKSKRARTVPLLPHTVQMLRRRAEERHKGQDYVFVDDEGLSIRYVFRWFDKGRRKAGLNNLRFHDLRHYYASWWMRNGGSEFKLQQVLGHATDSMTKRYTHLRADDLQQELDRVHRTAQGDQT